MVRARKPAPHNPATDKEVFKQELSRLQLSEVNHLVEYYEFTADEVVNALWPVEMVRLLREIVPYASSGGWYNDTFMSGSQRFKLVCFPERLRIVAPREGLIVPTGPRLTTFLAEMAAIVGRYERAEKLIVNLFKEYTMAEVRYLLPPLQSIVPPGHVLRTVKPLPTSASYEQAMLVREAVATLAKGLLSNPDRPVEDRRSLGFCTYETEHGTCPAFWVA